MSYQPKIAKGIDKAITKQRRIEIMSKAIGACYFVAVCAFTWACLRYLHSYNPALHWVVVRVMLAICFLILVRAKLSKKPDKLEVARIREETNIIR